MNAQQVSTFSSLSDHMFHQTNDDRVSFEIMGFLSVHLTFTAFGLELGPAWAATFLKMQKNRKKKDYTPITSTPTAPLHTHKEPRHVHSECATLSFIMTGLCVVHPTNTQSLIFPLNTSLSRCFTQSSVEKVTQLNGWGLLFMSLNGDVSLQAGCTCTWHTVSMNMISEIIKNLTAWPNYPSLPIQIPSGKWDGGREKAEEDLCMAGWASSGINYNYFMLLLCQSIGAVMDRSGVAL